MSDFADNFDGFTYEANWERISAGRLTWSAVVRNSEGEWCGGPAGKMFCEGLSDAQCLAAVRQAIDDSISNGIQVNRGDNA